MISTSQNTTISQELNTELETLRHKFFTDLKCIKEKHNISKMDIGLSYKDGIVFLINHERCLINHYFFHRDNSG